MVRALVTSATFMVWTGHMPRGADFQVLDMLAGPDSEDLYFVETLAEYIWDHWLGEPEEFGPLAIEASIWILAREIECLCGVDHLFCHEPPEDW